MDKVQRVVQLQLQLCNLCNFTVPEWSGWISQTSSNADRHFALSDWVSCSNSTSDYRVCYSPRVSSYVHEVTSTLQQTCTLVAVDLAAAKIAYDIIWGNPDKFSKVVIHLGAFHTMCSYMGAL